MFGFNNVYGMCSLSGRNTIFVYNADEHQSHKARISIQITKSTQLILSYEKKTVSISKIIPITVVDNDQQQFQNRDRVCLTPNKKYNIRLLAFSVHNSTNNSNFQRQIHLNKHSSQNYEVAGSNLGRAIRHSFISQCSSLLSSDCRNYKLEAISCGSMRLFPITKLSPVDSVRTAVTINNCPTRGIFKTR